MISAYFTQYISYFKSNAWVYYWHMWEMYLLQKYKAKSQEISTRKYQKKIAKDSIILQNIAFKNFTF